MTHTVAGLRADASVPLPQVQLVGVPFFWAASALQTVTDGMQRTKPGLYANAAGSFVSLVLCGVFVHPALCGWGFLGMAAARSCSAFVQLGCMVWYIRAADLQACVWRVPPLAAAPGPAAPKDAGGRRTERRTEPVLHPPAFARYLRITLPAAVVWWVEWWAFEGLTIMVGLLPTPKATLAAHGTLFNVLVTFYQVSRSFSRSFSLPRSRSLSCSNCCHSRSNR
jgi:Na+-driven multidrug efflux pump